MKFLKIKIILPLLTVVLIITMLLSNANSQIRTIPGNVFGTMLIPFQNTFSFVDKKIRNFALYFNDIKFIRQENEKLKAKIDELEKNNRELIEYKQKINELKQALNIKDRFSQFDVLGANIIAKDPGNWFDIFTLDVGSNDGVEENTTVLTGSGLVGKVIQVNVFSSRVISIIDPDNTVSARISKTRELVRIKGDMELKSFGICKMDYIPSDVDILKGDLVETSGMGGIYPKGIIIGTVKKISISPNEFTKQAEIEPVVDFKRLEEVYLLIKKNELSGYYMNFKILIYFISIVIISICQTIIVNYIRIEGIAPDFFLVFIVCNALIYGIIESTFIGVIFGLFVDILFAKIVGLNSLFFMYIALFAGVFNKKIYKDSVFPAVFFVGITTIIYNLYLVFIMFILKDNSIYWNTIFKTISIQIVYNMVITFIVHPFVLRMFEWGQVSTKIVRKY